MSSPLSALVRMTAPTPCSGKTKKSLWYPSRSPPWWTTGVPQRVFTMSPMP